jgi:hypothetical protein
MTCTTPTEKICTVCKTPKNTNQFNRHNGHKDKLGSNCKACIKEAVRKRRLNIPRTPKPPKPPKIKKIKGPVDPELVVDLPGIYPVENRGKGYTSFRFDSPIDGSIFSFSSFKEARKERQQMMSAFRQQAVFESVQRQSSGKKPAVDDEGDK